MARRTTDGSKILWRWLIFRTFETFYTLVSIRLCYVPTILVETIFIMGYGTCRTIGFLFVGGVFQYSTWNVKFGKDYCQTSFFCRPDVLQLTLLFFQHSNPEPSYQKTKDIKEQAVRVLLIMITISYNYFVCHLKSLILFFWYECTYRYCDNLFCQQN